MDVSMPKFEISTPGLLRKYQIALTLLLFSRDESILFFFPPNAAPKPQLLT